MERILLTGAGMVGAQIIKLLVDEYHLKPVVIDLEFRWPYLDTIVDRRSFVAVQGSIFDRDLVERTLKEHTIHRVVHTAAALPMRVGHAAHPGFYQVNTWGTANLMFACVACGVERFVMFSTNSVYQFRQHGVTGPVNEDYPTGLNPHNSYGNSKATAEFLLRELTEDGAFDGKIIRPGEIYGPVMQREGDTPIYWKAMLDAAIQGRSFVLEGHPEHRLDWVYCKDVARLACLLLMAEKTPHIAYNASYGRCMGIYDIAVCLYKLFPGHQVELRNCGRGGWNYPLNVDRARDDLGFRPQFDLERGIQDYMEWYKEFHLESASQ